MGYCLKQANLFFLEKFAIDINPYQAIEDHGFILIIQESVEQYKPAHM